MKPRTYICLCGHWESRHEEYEGPEDWRCVCKTCGCIDFAVDWEMMRDLENEAKQLAYDVKRGK